jgi:hypothetical protein
MPVSDLPDFEIHPQILNLQASMVLLLLS